MASSPLPYVTEAWDNRVPQGMRRLAHAHGGHELMLVWGPEMTVLRAGVRVPAPPGTLFLHRADEQHGWIATGAAPRVLTVNYTPDEAFERDLGLDGDARRVWRLDADRLAAYLDVFTRLQVEVDGDRPGRAQAASAWLRVLLVHVARLDAAPASPTTAAAMRAVDPELHRLRRAIDLRRQGSVDDALGALVDNYDSLRHRFRRAYGESPGRMLARLRLEKARTLLASTALSMAEVAEQCGYGRQHEFARAFRRAMGCTPTAYRRQARGR